MSSTAPASPATFAPGNAPRITDELLVQPSSRARRITPPADSGRSSFRASQPRQACDRLRAVDLGGVGCVGQDPVAVRSQPVRYLAATACAAHADVRDWGRSLGVSGRRTRRGCRGADFLLCRQRRPRTHHRGMEPQAKSCATCFHYAAHFSLDMPRRQSDGWCCVSLPDGGHRAVNRDEVCSDWVSYPLFRGFLP